MKKTGTVKIYYSFTKHSYRLDAHFRLWFFGKMEFVKYSFEHKAVLDLWSDVLVACPKWSGEIIL